MSTLRRWIVMAAMGIAPALQAQTCSGGPDGGMDATGHQCNPPDIALSSPVDATRLSWLALRDQGLADYERGNYDAAVKGFRRAAEQGDVSSAVMIVLMHRHNVQLYGGRVPVSDDEARHWAAHIAKSAEAKVAADMRVPR